ncbi:MAG TPA: PD-(D/E)XK nuclease family protein [Solirubrobacteraceae bacterium]|nr:PD-(D/E)XK nuclease family protein [Solirubrobacteraceae bacterium]
MPLTLVLGPANSAKAGEVLGAYAEAAPRGALLVVPNLADADHYSRELAEQGCVLRSVLTFTGLAERIAWAAGYAAPRLTALQRERVIRRAVDGCRLDALAAAARTPGFAAAAGQLISELQRSLITPQRFAAGLGAWAQEDEARQPYAAEVGAICLAYSRQLERLRRVDGELFAWRALDALRAAPGRWGSTPVFFYGFDDLTPLEQDAVETLARVVGTQVMVSLTFEAGKAATAAQAELVAELRPLADTVNELPARQDFYAPASQTALHHLERALFEPGHERVDPGSAVRLLESAGELAEAELVASEVLAWLDRGVPAEEIAVVVRALESGASAINQTLRRYGVPVASDSRARFAHTALGRSLLGLARCALLGDRARADDLLDYLRAPGRLGPEVADGLERRARRQGLSSATAARQALGFEVDEIDALRAAADPLDELARQGRRLLGAAHRGQAAVLGAGEELDALALSALLALPAQLAEVGEAPCREELLELLEALEVKPPGGPGAGAVLLSDPLALRARRFRVVVVCGLEEGTFPRAPAPEPFLPDDLRRELTAASGLRLRPTEDAVDRERYLFYAVLSRASEELVLSYRSSDEDGNLKLPSPFLADVEAVLDSGWPKRRRRRSLADVVWPLDEAPTPRERARAQAAALAPAAGEPPAPDRHLHAPALAAARHSRVVSAGALESYAQCPVKWLVERELSPRPLEPDPEPLVRGSYAHDLLEQILAQLGRAVTPESLPAALELLEAGLVELSPRLAPGRSPALRRAVGEAIAGDLRRYLEHEARYGSGWEPHELELGFGFDPEEADDSLPPLALEQDGEQITVRGMIDRVDVEPGGRRALVRDYKSGPAKSQHRGSKWREEQQLQVALYMLAVRDLLGLEPVAGLYQPLGGRDLRARGIYTEGAPVGAGLVDRDARDLQELADELQDASARAVALAVRLRRGEVEPAPATCSRDGCRYPGICRSV